MNPLELHDNKTDKLTEFFEGLEISTVIIKHFVR